MIEDDRPCRRCGTRIRFITGPNDKAIPVHRVRTLYQVDPSGKEPRLVKLAVPSEVWVSHFETCPYAKNFSKGRHRGGTV